MKRIIFILLIVCLISVGCYAKPSELPNQWDVIHTGELLGIQILSSKNESSLQLANIIFKDIGFGSVWISFWGDIDGQGIYTLYKLKSVYSIYALEKVK